MLSNNFKTEEQKTKLGERPNAPAVNGGAFPKGHPALIRQVALDPPESHTCAKRRYRLRDITPSTSALIKARNEAAHRLYGEELQDGHDSRLSKCVFDMKSFLITHFTQVPTVLTAKNIETLVSTLVLLHSSSTAVSRIAVITLCLNSLTGKAVSERVVNFISSHCSDFTVSDENLQSSDVREMLDSWDRLNDSTFVEKIRNVASYCMAFSVLETLGLPETAAEIVYAEFKVQKRPKQVTSFVHAILDAVEFTFSRMIVCVKEGTLSPLLHTTSTYTDWFDQTQKLEKWTSMLTCDPKTLEFTQQVYEKELFEAIKVGQNFVKHAKSVADRKTLTLLVNRMELYLADFQTKHIVGQSRIMPFACSLFGDSSVGKSSFTDILFSFSAKVLNQKDDPEFKYTRNFRDPFMSGFKSHMWFIVLDDIGSVKPSAANGTDPSIDEIIALLNTVPYCCNMADLSEKGRVAARPEVVIGTTNHPWMNVHHYAYHPTALLRRFPYRITVKVNKAYQMPKAPTMLDPSKCIVDYSREYPDFWDITVDKMLAAPLPENQLSQPTCEPVVVPIMVDVRMKDFLPWYRETLVNHMKSQKTIKSNMSTLSKVTMCDHLIPIGNCDECAVLQFGEQQSSIIGSPTIMSLKEQLFAFVVYLYLWWIAGLTRERASIHAYRKAVPMLRLANATTRTVDGIFQSVHETYDTLVNYKNNAYLGCLPTRTQVGGMADAVYKAAMENKKLAGITAAILAVAMMKKFLSTAEALQFSFMKPIPQEEKKAAKWTNDTIHLSPLTLSRQTKSMKGLSEDQIVELVGRNVVNITMYLANGNHLNNNMLALGGNLYAMNTHVLKLCPDEFRMDCMFMPSAKAGTRNSSILFNKLSVKKVIDDISFVELNNFPPFARLDHLLPTRDFKVRAHGAYVKRDSDGALEKRPTRNISAGHLRTLDVNGYYSECITYSGDCGMALLGFTAYGPVVMGLHTALRGSNGAFSSMLFRDDIEEFIIIDSGVVSLQCDDKTLTLYPTINRRDPLLFLDESNCAVYGSLSSGTSNLKSNVRKTFVAPFFEGKGWSTTHVKPNLGTWKPWYHGMKDMSDPKLCISSHQAQWLAEKTLSQYFSQLTESEKDLIQLYDIDTAVSGSPGVNYVNSLDMKTSLGFPWRRPKNEKIRFDTEAGIFYLDEELVKLVEEMIETYRLGERCNSVFCGSEKDEARAKEKNDLGKIRLFMGAPTTLVVVMRMFFGSLIRVVQRNPDKFGCAVGINAHSKEWHMLATRLLKFGPNNLFDGDYQAYDKKMEAVLIYSCIVAAGDEIIKHLQNRCGFTILELKKIYRAIAADVAFAYIDFNGTLVSFLRNHVSGEPLTVIINCFAGGVYVRFAYLDVVKDDPELNKFLDRIGECYYGDDNVLSVHEDVIDTFNFATMQTSLQKINVVYTRADKKSGSYKSKHLDQIEFLKRGFVYNEDLGRYVGPLAESSIQKSFLIGLCSKSITPEERDLATMTSGLREYFFHGKKRYDEIRALIIECCESMSIKYNPKNFPPYEYYLGLFKSQDIVHFQFFEYEEEQEQEEVLQCGSIYAASGSDGEKYQFSYFDGDFSIEKSPFGNFRVSHIAFIPIPSLKTMMTETGMIHSWRSRFITKARFYHLRTKWNREYTHSLISKIGTKLTEVVNEDIQWEYLQLRAYPEEVHRYRLALENTPFPVPNNNRRFTHYYERNSRSSITVVPVSQSAGGAGDYTPDASSGISEHRVRQDYEDEVLQTSKEIIMSFADETKGTTSDLGKGRDTTRDTSVYKDATISKFLERPVLISTTNWAENTNTNILVNPFYAFFNDSRIKNKITNYSLLRCNMKIKVLINASPFYYGLAKAVWKPLPNYAPDTFLEVVGQDGWRMPYSQIPGFYIHVESNEGGEMTLPFFYHKNWLRITSADDTNEMGTLQIRSFTPLLNANSVSSSDVTIQIYAWAEDVELSGPTVAEALQAGDEYTADGPISGPASAVAESAGVLSKVPIFKPYAMATQMISSGVADMARFFGFTNVANIESEKPQHPGAFLGMASTNLMTPFESLTIDDKNELSIDPRIAGLEPKDELMITTFCGRESWLSQSSWSSSASVNNLLFISRVLPELIRNEGGTVYRQSTPMAHVNRLFSNWRGEIRFRFQFICSKYHRGRVRITYDPDGNLFTNAVTSTTSVTRIVDISEETNVEIIVPFMQALSFLKTMGGTTSFAEYFNAGTTAVTRDPQFDNGQISVRVFTKQTSPVSDAPILMNVYVSAPDIEFAAPSEAPQDYSTEVLQSSEELSVIDTDVEDHDTNIHLVHFGEKIVSLRQLLRRKNLYYVGQLYPGTNGNASASTLNKFTLPRMPVPYGYIANGGFQSPGILVPGTQFRSNYVATTPLSHLLQCFVGVTGSMVYTVNVDSPFPVDSIYVARATQFYDNTATGFKPVTTDSYIDSAHGAISKLFYLGNPRGGTGRVLTNQLTQAGLTFKLPMYSNRRFLATSTANVQATTKVDGSELDTFTTVIVTKPNGHNAVEKSTQVQYYYMAGADFNMLYFRNVPTYYVYNLPWPTT